MRYFPIVFGRRAAGGTGGRSMIEGNDRRARKSLWKMSTRRRQAVQPFTWVWMSDSTSSPASIGINSSSAGQVRLLMAEVLQVRLALFANAGHDAGRVDVDRVGRHAEFRPDFGAAAALQQVLLEAGPRVRRRLGLHLLEGEL